MRIVLTAAQAAALTTLVLISGAAPAFAVREATAVETCGSAAAATPMAALPIAGTPVTPMAEMGHGATGTEMDLDQIYIDMMIPHHQSIIAMARAALPRLSDERLHEIAGAVVATQQPEIEQLRAYRETFSGEAAPMPMDDAMMATMHEMLPHLSGTMDDMTLLMDAESLVAAFCAAEDPDLAFIDLTIPHHQMAIDASLAAVEQAGHPEIRDLAQRVIDAQQKEIETLMEIRGELAGNATPAAP